MILITHLQSFSNRSIWAIGQSGPGSHGNEEGACGVMVIIIGNGHKNPSSNSGWDCLHSGLFNIDMAAS